MAVGEVVLENRNARASVVPSMGAGMARLDVRDKDGIFRPLLRPWQGTADPFTLGCNVLVPFSNRCSGGGFWFQGQFYEVERNLANEAFPIHGDGFLREWEVVERSANKLKLFLPEGSIGPFRYQAELTLVLFHGNLTASLKATSTSEVPLPFGFGFHPWFPRTQETKIRFLSDEIWLENGQHLPTQLVSIEAGGPWDFSSARALPSEWINNGFMGWTGVCEVEQGPDAQPFRLRASEGLNVALLYSPGAGSDFFCFEPVSHPVDAHNIDCQPGLRILAPRESCKVSITLEWDL